ncbi:MAG: FRG domain-containing protein, partial [Hyphomicrobiales bacterium]|nr:FRG domain-containing protein [Hyphomicrobiales bacterium]
FPGYDLFAHVRHHGLPSPLLDWSRSLYVAAYFAFATADKNAEGVAIYAYVERPGGMKLSSSDHAQIVVAGPNVRTHQRHFRQQSCYTMSVHYKEGEWHYVPHHEGITPGAAQDRIFKFTMPIECRMQVLSELDRHNLNAYSLFGTEEALMQTLWFREINEMAL